MSPPASHATGPARRALSSAAQPRPGHQLLAEFIGTAALFCAVIGSGIMAETLSAGNNGVALLANTLATVFALYVLIELLGPVSGAHFNPLVTLVLWSKGAAAQETPARTAMLFIAAQLLGAVAGAWLANAMFDLPVLQFSSKLRGGFDAAGQFSGWGQWLAEGVATAGLMLVVLRAPAGKAAAMVACYIGAAYWFTASTSFANPAAVMGRMFSDTFAGIAPASAPGFVLAEAIGAMIGLGLHRALGDPARLNA
ncbi:MAG: glycerol uptake facilitator [Polaromonas sp. 39-63-203]|jgi:glycerol uptake facilitator-like aquaporin|uniref:aquaporin n=1 Tax=Polaromonas sp. TaxID=1869339 RepID=UPI000BCFC270|nr:MIP/aquaporin family protein [Polaromonas sp.]OYY52270.1 MAG: glycerol uptake facilitator [Polaromonas sp. 35-63-240]OYY97863.1 MAG: glycerol uptake facilitator [Polaromonas sp. 28-63-22]OYZ84287.1 MAG: glycerol uptake facilitator [Polaromonas sp. 24-62-144]OZA97806.1 MAG: glycerol uptake facilitator [Polaromonas sp. 39-63-203]HQS31222.1 MIP/aquaporin family protein [Polaromonas sp.]